MKFEVLLNELRKLTDAERLDLFAHFCSFCGGTDVHCVCMRDD